MNTNLLPLWMHFQIHAHIQKLREQSLVQKDVDGNSLFPTYFLQVPEDVNVRENIHHHRDHLQREAAEGRAGCQLMGTPAYSSL